MTVEVRAYGQKCKETLCTYCYQRGNKKFPKPDLNLENLKERITDVIKTSNNESFVIFGGDAGAYDPKVRRELINWGYNKFGSVGIQTCGWWLDKDKIDWMNKCNVSIGLSVDGPWPLNEKRIFKNRAKTKKYTEQLMNLIPYMADKENLNLGLITTLHDSNLKPEDRFEKLKEWLKKIDSEGVGGNLHLLQEVEGTKILSDSVLEEKMIELAELERKKLEQAWKPFKDFRAVIKGKDENASCQWNNCDPFYTKSVKAIDRDGLSTCSRNYKEGLRNLKAEKNRPEIRKDILENTPQKEKGCKDCEWWGMCTGGCPGTAIDGDWRNKTIYCNLFKRMFNYYRKNLPEGELNQGNEDKNDNKRGPSPERIRRAKEQNAYHKDQNTIHLDSSHQDSIPGSES